MLCFEYDWPIENHEEGIHHILAYAGLACENGAAHFLPLSLVVQVIEWLRWFRASGLEGIIRILCLPCAQQQSHVRHLVLYRGCRETHSCHDLTRDKQQCPDR